MLFLNEFSKNDFNKIYKNIKPASYYGKVQKEEFTPFIRDKINQAKKYYENLDSVIKWETFNPDKAKHIRSKLGRIESIDYNLESLEEGSLENINFYEVRKFIITTHSIISKLNETKLNKFVSSHHSHLDQIKAIFNNYCDLETGFNISNSKFDKLSEINKEIEKINSNIKKLERKRQSKISSLLERKVEDRFIVHKRNAFFNDIINFEYIATLQKEEEYYILSFCEDEKILDLKEKTSQKKKAYLVVQNDIKRSLIRKIFPYFERLRNISKVIGWFDLLLAKSDFFQKHEMCLPKLVDYPEIKIKSGYHPLLEDKLRKTNQLFTPRSINITKGVVALTGINMGGKTITLRMINLFGILVSFGMPIPAKECQFPLFDLIYFSNKINDTINSGLSLFGKEIKDIQFALNNKDKYGLILIDEIASGANPEIGKHLTHAFIEEMFDSNSIVILTTHYSGVNNYSKIQKWRTKGVKEEIKSLKDLNMNNISDFIDYSLEESEEDYTSDDILKVVEMLGLNERILSKTKDMLSESGC